MTHIRTHAKLIFMSTATTAKPEADILARLIRPENRDLTPEVAHWILQLRFPNSDMDRMNELAAKARTDSLSSEEEEQLHGYLTVGAMIDLMHSKARLSLNGSRGTGDG
jgi:hypothetical protein